MRFVNFLASFFLLLAFSVSAFSQGTDLLDRNFSGTSKEATPQAARRDIMEQAYENVSEDVIKDLIGEERYSRNKSVIKAKILRNAARYIPFSKPTEPALDPAGFKMSVALRLSLKDLKTLLQDNGLLNENESTPIVLPVVNFVDHVGLRSFRWWQNRDQGAKGLLVTMGKQFENSLRGGFQKNGFYLLKPQESNSALDIPVAFQNEKLNPEDSQFLGQFFNATVLLDGQVRVTKSPTLANSYQIELKLTATQISNSRPIADVSRRYDTESGNVDVVVEKKVKEIIDGVSSDLSSQVFEAWQRGSLGTSTLRLTLQGKMNLLSLEAFKEKLKNQIPQIRSVRERLFEAGKFSFEIDTSASAKEIVQRLQGLDIDGKKLNQVSESNNEITIQIN
jgi:hypothetical protein